MCYTATYFFHTPTDRHTQRETLKGVDLNDVVALFWERHPDAILTAVDDPQLGDLGEDESIDWD